jgi:hypothetical protein
VPVIETHFDPNFDATLQGGGGDVGVAIVGAPLGPPPLPYNRAPLDSTMVGQPARLVGYGITSGSDTTGASAGIKRETTTQLMGVDALLLRFGDGTHNTCKGDSGGPAFMTIDGVETIVGVTSSGDPSCVMGSYFTRIDSVLSFIDGYVQMFDPGQADMGGGVGAPGTVGADCSDDSQCQSKLCAKSGATGYCTASCDPANAGSCATGTHCGIIDGANYCLRDAHGCDALPGAPVGGAPLTLLALVAIALVRRLRS